MKGIMRRVGFLIVVLLLAACSGGEGDPAQVVERYLQAKIAGDSDTVRGLLCAEMESLLTREANAFASVTGATIENMQCSRNEGADTVTCAGQIAATYGAEVSTFPLTTYRVVQEAGEWKWCGEAGG